MRSRTRTPRKPSVTSTCATLERAASHKNQPIKAIQRPPNTIHKTFSKRDKTDMELLPSLPVAIKFVRRGVM